MDEAEERAVEDILDTASMYRLVTGFRALDFACGEGALLIELAKRIPKLRACGIDISDVAINEANRRKNLVLSQGEAEKLIFRRGSFEVLQELAESGECFDLISIREAYFQLSSAEQGEFGRLITRLLRAGGILFIEDIATIGSATEIVRKRFADRLRAGEIPIANSPVGGSDWSVNLGEGAKYIGLEAISLEVRVDDVRRTYEGAATLKGVSDEYMHAYRVLAQSCKQKPFPLLVYFRSFYLARNREGLGQVAAFGFTIEKDIRDVSNKAILRSGESFYFRFGRWNLLVGRSGSARLQC